MTNEEAKNIINKRYIGIGSNDVFAFKKAIEALEKQILKKPLEDKKYFGVGKCPVCGVVFISEKMLTPFCGNCGQALDWSDENDKTYL